VEVDNEEDHHEKDPSYVRNTESYRQMSRAGERTDRSSTEASAASGNRLSLDGTCHLYTFFARRLVYRLGKVIVQPARASERRRCGGPGRRTSGESLDAGKNTSADAGDSIREYRRKTRCVPANDDNDLDIILGRWINNQHYFFPTLDGADAVKVIARREDADANAPALAFLYGPLVDVYKAKGRGEAIGWYCLAGGAGLIILDEEPNDPKTGDKIPGLLIADNVGNIQVLNGSIQVNTIWEGTKWNNDPPAALCVKAGGNMLCGRLTITGHTDPEPPIDEGDLNGWDDIWEDPDLGQMPYDILEGAPYMPDPLRDLVPPTIPTDPNDANNYIVKSYTKNTSVRLDPGYYPDGIEMTADGVEVNLNPGTYILGGGNGTQLMTPATTADGLSWISPAMSLRTSHRLAMRWIPRL
jgi:hypothetical protein